MKPATTVVKVCRVLEAMTGHPSVGLTEVAQRTGLLPSDVHRILGSLEACGYVIQSSETKRYKAGRRLLQLGWSVTHTSALQRAGLPALFQLSKRCGATANLAVFDRASSEVILIHQAEVSGDGRFEGCIGDAKPVHCTALGKAVLANLDQTSRSRAIDRSRLAERTPNTITCLNLLEQELLNVRRAGYAQDCEEMTEAACCLASPIFDRAGTVIASIGITMSARRFAASPRKLFVDNVLTSAAMLSNRHP